MSDVQLGFRMTVSDHHVNRLANLLFLGNVNLVSEDSGFVVVIGAC